MNIFGYPSNYPDIGMVDGIRMHRIKTNNHVIAELSMEPTITQIDLNSEHCSRLKLAANSLRIKEAFDHGKVRHIPSQ